MTCLFKNSEQIKASCYGFSIHHWSIAAAVVGPVLIMKYPYDCTVKESELIVANIMTSKPCLSDIQLLNTDSLQMKIDIKPTAQFSFAMNYGFVF